MRRNIYIAITVSTILAGFGFAQHSASSAYHFRWSTRKAEELDFSATIRKSKLPVSDQQMLIKAISALIRPFKKENEIESERELHLLAANTRIKLVDLNDDGIPEILAQANDYKAGCGATGNCSFWVFQKTSAGFRKILDTRGPDGIGGIEVFTINPNRTEGYNELVLGSHDSATARTLLLYRFVHGRYRESGCYIASWISTEGGKYRQLEVPDIFPCPAN
jgi:hypothetical protein